VVGEEALDVITETDRDRLLARAEAVASLLGSDDGTHLLTAYRRAANILRIEDRKDEIGRAHV